MYAAVLSVSKNTFSPLQVKNEESDGDSEHVFILGWMDCTVANSVGCIRTSKAH
jgi:hypothetical protein